MTQISSESAETLFADAPVITAASSVRFSNKRAYAQTFAATIAIRGFGVVSGILAARLLGPQGRGELATIIFLPIVLVPIGELELPRAIAFEASRRTDIRRELVASGFWLAAVLGCIQALVLVVALTAYLPSDKSQLLSASRQFIWYLPAAYVTSTLIGIDQGRGRFGRFSVLYALPGVLYVVSILAAWGSGHVTPHAFALGLLVATLATAAVRTGMDIGPILRTAPHWQITRQLLGRGMSFYLPAVAGFLLSRADMFLLVRLASSEAVGLYAIAQAIAIGQIGAISPFVQVGFAAVAGETEHGAAILTLVHHFRRAQFAVVGVGLISMIVAPWVIQLFFGAKFLSATDTTLLLIAASVFWGLTQVLEQGLRAAGHTRPGIVSNVAGLFVCLGLGIPACIHFGIVGLAWAYLLSQCTNLVFLILFCTHALHLPLRKFWAFEKNTALEIRFAIAGIFRHLRMYASP